MSLGNEYSGANVDFINDSTQDALNLKANLDGGNVFTGGAGEINRFETTLFIDPANIIQAKNIWGFQGLTLNTTFGDNIILNPDSNNKVKSTGSIDLSAGKEYLIDGVNVLDAKANLAGGNTFTGDQIVDNVVVGGDIKGVNNQDLNILSTTNGVNVTAISINPTGDTEMDGRTTFKKGIIGGNSQSLSAGVRVIDSTRLITKLDTRAGNITATISNGLADGQIKIINLHRADATQYTATLLTNVSEPITLKNVGEGVILAWSGNTADWNVVAKNVSFLNNDLSVDGDINLSAGKQYLIDGVASVGISPAQATQIVTNTTDIASKADDDAVVKLTGNQTINGEKNFPNDTRVGADLILNSDEGIILLGANSDRKIYRTADGIRTNNAMDATQFKVSGTQIASTDLGDVNTLVKTSGSQSISGIKTFNSNTKIGANLNISTDIGEITLGALDDRNIGRTADGIITNGTMDATQYKVNGFQIASTDLGDVSTLVKTSGDQTIAGEKTFSSDMEFGGDLLIRTNDGEIKFGEGDDRTIARTADGISTNGTMDATQYKVSGTQIASADLGDVNTLVKTSGQQTIAGEKTFSADLNLNNDLKLQSNGGRLFLGTNDDRNIARSADGISTNGTMDATQYKVSGTQIASTDLGDNTTLVKTSGNQTIAGEKTFSDKMVVNDDLHMTGQFKHTFNSSTTTGILLDNNNVNQYALTATTQNYGWRFIGESTSGSDTDLFDVRSKKGGISHKVFEVTNADNIKLTGNVLINTFGNKLNITYQGIPLGTGVANADPPSGAQQGDIYRSNDNSLKITPP